jgi:hypothetical protein
MRVEPAAAPSGEKLPKRRGGSRPGPAPDLSSRWWSSLDDEERLARQISDVLMRTEVPEHNDVRPARFRGRAES